jgi:hypothetical protein
MRNLKSVIFNMKIKLNTDLNGFKMGRVINVDTDASGTVVDKFWRARLKDSEIDNCVEVVIEKKSKSSKRAK